MSLVIKDKDGKRSPHLALCHEAQGFSANNRSVSLLMKSGVELTEDVTKALETMETSLQSFTLEKEHRERKTDSGDDGSDGNEGNEASDIA